jgi:ferric-dicitrate binding protein FerR (iron transport regulator)
MNRQEKNPNMNLERAVAEMRADEPSPEILQSASDRVWSKIQQNDVPGIGDSIHGCSDVKTLLIQYRAGTLADAKSRLVEAHLHECVDCRRFADAGNRSATAVAPWTQELPRMDLQRYRWAGAAAAMILLLFSTYLLREKFFAVPAGMRASIVSLEGGLYRVGVGSEQPLKTGDEIGEDEKVRTATGAHAMLRLRDGSQVEMNERAQLGVSIRNSDTTINLDRGKVIVQAAKRKTGHLYVAANDVKVSVTGTVFSVNSGMKGSRVSVIEGEVRAAGNGVDGVMRTAVLHPGDQFSTDAAGAVPVKQEIAWSRNLDQHLALLAEFAHLSNKLDTVQLPGLRYQSAVLPTLPAATILYASIPNLGDAVQQGNQIFQQELRESAVLQQWWTRIQSRKGAPDFSAAIEEIHSLSQYLGNEIAFTVSLANEAEPLAVAQVQRPGLKQFIEQEAARHESGAHYPAVRVFDETQIAAATSSDTETPRGKRHNLYLLVRPDFVAAAFDLGALKRFNQTAAQGGGFASTAFGKRIQNSYQQGAGFLFAANLLAMTQEHAARHPNAKQTGNFTKSGLADVQYLIAERKDIGDQPLNHAELTFNGPRQGIASWLAAPAPIGAFDFVSKDAGAAAAFVAKNPSQMLDDLLSMAGSGAEADMAKGESELKIRFRQDVAETLGGEVAFALDGPLLPTPSWKVVLEVYSPGRLQSTMQQLIADVNDNKKNTAAELMLSQQTSGGNTFYTIQVNEGRKNFEIDYAFVDGYMVIAPSRALVMSAINTRQSGNSLSRSDSFRSLLPKDQHADVSAVLYQNLAPVVGPIMNQLTPSQLQSLQQLAAETNPSVVCAYGEPQAITIASESRLFGLDLNTLTLSALLKIAHPGGSRASHME